MDSTPPVTFVDALDLDSLAPGLHRQRVRLGHDAAGRPLTVPVLVSRSRVPGPVVGITAAVHGNELNGIPLIQRLFGSEAVQSLRRGTLVAVPIVNVAGFLVNRREHHGQDLNHIMPGRPDGTVSEIYAHRFFERVVRRFEYLLDLHTASFGRVNTFYVRANMTIPVVAELARLVRPQIIVHNASADGTLRRAATQAGIHALTLEVGDPQRIQSGLIRLSGLGIQEVLARLDMVPDPDEPSTVETVECSRSEWLYTDEGGILEVPPKLGQRVAEGEVVGVLRDVWGDVLREYRSPAAAIVVGKSQNPVAFPGSRVLHLGHEGRIEPAAD